MAISQAIIEEIKARSDIEEVISTYVTLKRAGSNMVGLCPFHSEKSPSFTVFRSTQNFYCFGCGAGGDAITFIMKSENLDYPSALEFLAKRAGIEIPAESRNEKRGDVSRTRVLDMNREAAKFFHSCLMDTKKYPAGMEYFKKRGLSLPFIKHFGLGYAPGEWSALTDHLKSKGYRDEEIITAFLGGRSQKTGRAYDYFRNRVIFPIIDLTGNVIAFGGRVLDDSKPKYLNSSDTPAFKKSRNLFALNFAKEACADRLILCEGYMDVVTLHSFGFINAVATLGTAITPEQARIMKRYTKEVLISYDSDEAGQRAADKAFRLLSEAGLDTKVIKMEGAKDPDEFLKKFGREKFAKVLDGSRTEFEFRMNGILGKYDLSSPSDKIKASGEIADMISAFPSAVEREVYITAASKALELPAETIKADVARSVGRKKKKQDREEMKKIVAESSGYGDRVNPDFVKNPAAASAEEAIIGILLLHPEEIERIKADGALDSEDFVTQFGKRVFSAILDHSSDGAFSEAALGEEFSGDEMGRIIGMKMKRAALSDNTRPVLNGCIERLRQSKKTGDGIDDIQKILEGKRKERQGSKNE